MEQDRDIYLEEFPANEEGLLLVDDLELIEALRRRAEHQVTSSVSLADTQQRVYS